jgi:ABC-type polysaccharide/polyol phosphate export permease
MHSVLKSIYLAFRQWPIWLWFGRQDIRSRYRGSLLGPLWLVLNLGILVAGLSIIYATIFSLRLEVYVPYVALGFIIWWFVSGSLTESCYAFTANAQIIRNMPLPLSIHVLRVLTRQTLLMAHNLVVYIIVAIVFDIRPTANIFLVIPGFLLVTSLLFTGGLSLAIICARYRDVPHIVSSVIQVVIFITPILFLKDMLKKKMLIADMNPFFHIIEAMRAPLLGQAPEMLTWEFLIVANLLSALVAVWLMRRAGHRVAYLV